MEHGCGLHYSLRRFGSARWKRLQRWNYVFFGLVLVHAIAYQVIEKRQVPFVIALSVLVLGALTLQLQGYRRGSANEVRDGAVGRADCS